MYQMTSIRHDPLHLMNFSLDYLALRWCHVTLIFIWLKHIDPPLTFDLFWLTLAHYTLHMLDYYDFYEKILHSSLQSVL